MLRFQLKYLDILAYYVLKQVMFKFPLFTSSLIDWHKPKLYQLILVTLSNYRTICHVIYNSYLEEYPWVIAWLYSTIKLFHKCANNNYWKHIIQGLGGYFQDPGFDQNTVWDSGKLKIPWGERDLTATWKEGYTGIWAQDAGFSCLFVRNSGYCTF